MTRVLAVVGNPRPGSRTHQLARTLAQEIARATGGSVEPEVDLAAFGPRVLDDADAEVSAAGERVLDADVLVVASPTYKATYSGLAKAFLDRLDTGSLQGRRAVPLLLGGAPNHQLAVDVHFTPLLLDSHVSQMLVTLSGMGLIYKNRWGRYSFAVPLFHRFILHQQEAIEALAHA